MEPDGGDTELDGEASPGVSVPDVSPLTGEDLVGGIEVLKCVFLEVFRFPKLSPKILSRGTSPRSLSEEEESPGAFANFEDSLLALRRGNSPSTIADIFGDVSDLKNFASLPFGGGDNDSAVGDKGKGDPAELFGDWFGLSRVFSPKKLVSFFSFRISVVPTRRLEFQSSITVFSSFSVRAK